MLYSFQEGKRLFLCYPPARKYTRQVDLSRFAATMSSVASSDADARALAALLGTELGAALMQGGMQVLMLPPRKEQPPLGDSEKSHPRLAASAAKTQVQNHGGDFSTPSEAAAPLQSPTSHNAPPPRGTGARGAGLGGIANEVASASVAMSFRRASSDTAAANLAAAELVPRSPAARSPSSTARHSLPASPGLGGLAHEAASVAQAMSLRRASSDSVGGQPPAVLAPETTSAPRAPARATATSPSTSASSSPGSLSRGRQHSFERSAVRRAKSSSKVKEPPEGAPAASSAVPASPLAPAVPASAAPASAAPAPASTDADADADADADTFAEQSEMGTAVSVSSSARWRSVRQQSELGAAVSGFAFGGGLADRTSLPAASVSAMGAAARRGPSCCQLARARAGRDGHGPPSHMRRSIAAANVAAEDEANEAARMKAAEEEEARRLWEATFGSAAGPPPPGTAALPPTGPGRSAAASAARYPPPPLPPPPAAATTGAAAWLAAAEEEEDAEMVSAEISASPEPRSSRAELPQLPTVTPPAKPKRSSSMLRRLSFGRKASDSPR